jgi:hypothetical protein
MPPRVPPDGSQHWLYQWIDEFDVNPGNLRAVFKSANAVGRLAALAGSAKRSTAAVETDAIVAGRTLDLHSQYTCGRFGCMKDRIERTFLSTWHYFDSVVVAGPSETRLVRDISTTRKADREKVIIRPLLNDVALFLHLREIGADKHIIFRQKNFNFHLDCYREAARNRGILTVSDEAARAQALESLDVEAHVNIWRHTPKEWGVEVDHDSLPERLVFAISSARKPTRQEALVAFLDRGSFAMLEDIEQAEFLELPLLQEVLASFFSGSEREGTVTDESVALQLELPFIRGIPVPELLKFMSDQRPSFDRFQGAIRKAVRERVEKAGDKSPSEISREIEKEILRPGLAEIDVSLQAAKRAFGKKAGAAIGVGTVLVSAGVLAAIPLVVAAGLTATASPMLDAKKFIEDRADLESKDMYFLWRMQNQAKRSH